MPPRFGCKKGSHPLLLCFPVSSMVESAQRAGGLFGLALDMNNGLQAIRHGMDIMPFHDPAKPLGQCYDEDLELIIRIDNQAVRMLLLLVEPGIAYSKTPAFWEAPGRRCLSGERFNGAHPPNKREKNPGRMTTAVGSIVRISAETCSGLSSTTRPPQTSTSRG